MTPLEFGGLLMALIGHAVMWSAGVNRIHATALPRWAIDSLSAACHSALLLLPAALASYRIQGNPLLFIGAEASWYEWWPMGYLVPCWGFFLLGVFAWLRVRHEAARGRDLLVANHTTALNVSEVLGSRPVENRLLTRLVTAWPGNQVLNLHVHHKKLVVPRLAKSLDGLKIAHLSDLHMTGKLTKPYFEEVIRRTNEMDADLILVTGDIFDSSDCFEWIEDTLAQLKSRLGTYYILGNHELHFSDIPDIRRRLDDAGLIDMGSRWIEIELHGERILLAGNELPWHGPSADMQSYKPSPNEPRALRILLSHSPDQIRWAQHHDFDLMLAGHTHGGQIRFPILGPIFVPSWLGIRFAAGLFYEPPTLLHVSRGVSGKLPVRINCPPELSLLELKSPSE